MAIETFSPKPVSWEEIKLTYPDQWVVLANPILDGTKVLTGIVISSHSDKRVASIEGGERRGAFKKFTLVFTGQPQPARHIGLLRTQLPVK